MQCEDGCNGAQNFLRIVWNAVSHRHHEFRTGRSCRIAYSVWLVVENDQCPGMTCHEIHCLVRNQKHVRRATSYAYLGFHDCV
jgi:hypothetical protein